MLKRARLIALAVAAIMVTAAAVMLAGCDESDKNKVYTKYTYSEIAGTFVKTGYSMTLYEDNKFVIEDNEYIDEWDYQSFAGEYMMTDKSLLFAEGAFSRADREQESMLVYKSYIVDYLSIDVDYYRISEKEYGETENLEGRYYDEIIGRDVYFKGGNINVSNNDSYNPDSFTIKIGVYRVDGDFITVTYDQEGMDRQYLMVLHENYMGEPERIFVDSFMAGKDIKLPAAADASYMEIEQTVFAKNEAGEYDLKFIKYPSKAAVSGVTYEVFEGGTEEQPATIDGAKLKFGGTGSIGIDISVDGRVIDDIEITIIDAEIDEDADEGITVEVGYDFDHWDIRNVVNLMGGISPHNFLYKVTSGNEDVAKTGIEAMHEGVWGGIAFVAAGETTITIKVTYQYRLADGELRNVDIKTLTFDVEVIAED